MHQDLGLHEVFQGVLDCVDLSSIMGHFAQGSCVARSFCYEDLSMDKRNKKMNFLIGWNMRNPRIEKIRERNQEALQGAFFHL